MTHSIFSQFDAVTKPVSKLRANVGSFCLTLDFIKASWVMIGVPDDRGVENNYGRVGAKEGPTFFREAFYAHSIASVSPRAGSIYDLGNFKTSGDLKDTLNRLKETISEIKRVDPKKKILVVGGGHDIAFGEIAGCLTKTNRKKHHIVNIDAHSDVRPLENGEVITSGTPFYRLIEEEGLPPQNYHPFGLQQTSNDSNLVAWMKKKKILPLWLEEMNDVQTQTRKFLALTNKLKNKPWHFDVDLDAFALSFAPGVSAPAVMGVSPQIFLHAKKIKSFSTLQSLGIYELNPKHDVQNVTAKLAAKIAYLILSYST